ncbi:MAG: hypothetical protein M1819_004255 [Sarea resinae]|nr:MAG: hypothetical protein M1819_004255 [Sarea resinae]
MPPDSSSFTALNLPQSQIPEWMGSFSLHAPPNTDLWRKPPSRDTSTAPILYTALRHPFIAAEVTICADWELEWDQAGLVIFAGAPPGRVVSPSPSPSPSTPATSTITTSATAVMATTTTTTTATSTTITEDEASAPPPPYSSPATNTPPASKWLKAGLEFANNAVHASSVCATSDGADWALSPLPASYASRSDLRVKLERIGFALWIWIEDSSHGGGGSGGVGSSGNGGGGGAGWKKLREVTWFFWGVEDKAIRIGVYASRPANFGASTVYERRHGGGAGGIGQRSLVVDFEDLEIF